jgi:hypothetical protein
VQQLDGGDYSTEKKAEISSSVDGHYTSPTTQDKSGVNAMDIVEVNGSFSSLDHSTDEFFDAMDFGVANELDSLESFDDVSVSPISWRRNIPSTILIFLAKRLFKDRDPEYRCSCQKCTRTS